MRGTSVHFDFRGQVCLGKRLLENGLVVGRARVVIFRDGNKELRLGFRSLKVRTVWRISHESAAMDEATAPTRSGAAAAVRNAIGPPMQ